MDKKISLGILGGKLRSSLSPLMFDHYFGRLNLDISYKLYPVASDMLSFFLSKTRTSDIIGLNVTIPFKEKIIPLLDYLDPEAKIIGAVNVIHNSKGRLKGYNTDYTGFLKTLDKYDFLKTGNAVILGAGGAARGIIYGLSSMKFKNITFFSRNDEKINKILSNFHFISSLNGEQWKIEKIKEKMKNADIVVNATPVGMFPLENKSPVEVDFALKKKAIVYDLIYNPKVTKFLKLAKNKGAVVENGLWMLIYQALESLKLWIGEDLNEEFFIKSSKEVLNA
ncbi:MAG: shikimate dehydrogenase [Candidatus Aminicenantes bacterium]|nr:MAG: shikimate dehydrogenase [Candidatus Aminicenantes bacterium]